MSWGQITSICYVVGFGLWLYSCWMNWRAFKRWHRAAEAYYQKLAALTREYEE